MLKRKTKSIISILCAIVLSGSLLAGCGSKDSDTSAKKEEPKENVTLEFWTISLRPTFDNYFNDLIKKYETEHPNIKINWTDMPFDAIQSKLITSIAGGTAPDVVNLNTEMALTLAGKGALVDLNKEAGKEQKDIYIKTLLESAKLKDGIYAFPWYGTPSVCMYNKALFEKAGLQNPPKTFDEMLSVAKQIKDKTGAYICIPDYYVQMLQLEGVKLLNDDNTKAAFNTPEAAEILTKYKKAVDEGVLPKTDWGNWDAMLQQFSSGKIAMINAGPQTLKRIKDEAPDIYKNIEVTTPLVGKANIIRNPLMNVAVPEKSKHHKEAIDFASFVTNDENQLAFCKAVQVFPSTTKASQDSFFKADSKTPETKALTIIADELKNTVDLNAGTEKGADISKTINNASEAVILGSKDVKSALNEAEAKVNSILSGK